MSCLLYQRTNDENLVSRAEILPETSLTLGSAFRMLSPCFSSKHGVLSQSCSMSVTLFAR